MWAIARGFALCVRVRAGMPAARTDRGRVCAQSNLLLRHGADARLADNQSRTPLHWAAAAKGEFSRTGRSKASGLAQASW
jgi:hypothetical protein